MKYDLEYVCWKDAATHETSWTTFSDYQDKMLPLCHSVGWNWKEDDEGVLLVSSMFYDDEEDVGGNDIHIPKSLILRREILIDGRRTDPE